MSVSSMGDVSSLDEVESELSFDGDAKVSPAPHMSAALVRAQASSPRRVSTRLPRVPSIRSSPSTRRPVTAFAPRTVPESVDRLKHLKTHMKHLQKLYNQEVHLEELAARDAFLQTMCTSSITLFRHCASRHRFFTAVKALQCQYLPASNAKLIQVERSSGSGKSFLVLQDSQTFEVAESETIGIAGKVAQAMLSVKDGASGTPDLSRSSSSNGSSEARTSDEATYRSAWLESHADCILPSANGHLLLLFPVHALYRIGFHQEIDLTARRRDGAGAQLLVMGLKSSSGQPIGIVEAVLPSDSQYNVEFLDAFGVLLGTALESRQTICRSVVDKLEIQVVESHVERSGSDQERLGSIDTTSSRRPVLSVPLLESSGRLDLFGGAAALPEQDEAFLQALQQPLTRLCSEKRDFRQQARGFESSLVELARLWANVSGGAVETNVQDCRAYFSEYMDRLNTQNEAEIDISSIQIRFLFRGETKGSFKRAYAAGAEHIDSDLNSFPGADDQLSVLQQVMDSGEAFESGGTMLVLPIRDEKSQQHDEDATCSHLPLSRAAAAMILIFPVASNSESGVSSFTRMIKVHVAPLLAQFAEHLLFKMKQRERIHKLQQRVEAMGEQEASLTVQITDGLILKDITQQFLSCSSLEQLMLCVNSIAASNEDVRSKFARATMFVASTKEPTLGRRRSIPSVWSLAEDVGSTSCKKLELVDERKPDEMRGCGIPSFVLFTHEPLSYSSSHHAFSPSRQDEYDCFYALPLTGSSSDNSLGVLEFAFESETQRERFLGDPLLLTAMTEVLTQVITLHLQFAGDEERICDEMRKLTESYNHVLSRWVDFVTKWSSLPLEDFDAWKSSVTRLLLELLHSDGYFVNLLCSVQNETDEENAAVLTILSDASRPPHSSNTLNVLNQTILPRCMAFPLKRSYESSGVAGVLAFSKKDDEPFTSEETKLGSMASYLLSNQVLMLERKAEFEAVIQGYEERVAEQLDTIARVESSSADLASDLQQSQTLLQMTLVPYDGLVSSLSIEQLCEKTIQTMSKSGVEQALSGDARSEVCILVFDVDQQVFNLVGSDCPRVSISTVNGREPWFSEHRISSHTTPFTSLPTHLVVALSQPDSIAIVPVCDNSESGKRELCGLLVVGNKNESPPTTDEYLLGLAACFSRVFRMKRDYNEWSATQQHLEASVSDLQTQKHKSGVWSELSSLAQDLWCDLLGVVRSHKNMNDWKRRLKTRLAGSLVKILRVDVEVTKVELTLGAEPRKLEDATTKGPDLNFTKDMVVSGDEQVFLGRLCVAWEPQDSSNLQQEELLALLEWLSTYLQNLLHHCFVFETVQARVGDSMAQCSALKNQASNDSKVIHQMEEEQRRWHFLRDVTQACVSVVENGIDGESTWCNLFATIRAIGHMKLKLMDETNSALWTILENGKRELKAFVLHQTTDRFANIELVCEQNATFGNETSRVVLGVLQVLQADEPPHSEPQSLEGDMVIQQLAIVLTHTLRIVRQIQQNRTLEDNVRQLKLESTASTSEWRQHMSICFQQMLTLQSEVSIFISLNASRELSVMDPKLWLRELLGVTETAAPSPSQGKTAGEVVPTGPRLAQLRSFLLFEGDNMPPVLHSCSANCRRCTTSTIATNVHELEATVEENGDVRGLVLDLREAAAADDSSEHPALSLLHSGCHVKSQNENRWALDTAGTPTHQLVVKTFRRTIPQIGVVRVLLIQVTERSAEIGNVSSWWQMLSFYGEVVLNAVQRLLHIRALYEQANILSEQLSKVEHTLTESRHTQENVERTLSGIVSVCQVLSFDLDSLDERSLSVQIEKVFRTLTGESVQAHLCVRATESEKAGEWEVVGGKHGPIATQELLQVVMQIVKTAATQGNTVSSDTWVENGIIVSLNNGNRRVLCRLFDAEGTIIGALVLDVSTECLALLQNKVSGSIKAVLQVTAAAVGTLRANRQHESQKRKMVNERDQLLVDKCQLELNSLEMKNLLHNNEAQVLGLRNHCEQVVGPTNSVVCAFLYELKDLKTYHDVIHSLGQAISSFKDVTGVQFTVVHQGNDSERAQVLFSSVTTEGDKRFMRSDEVYEATRKCIKQSEMIQVSIDNSRTDVPGASSCRCVVLYPLTVPKDAQAKADSETSVDASAELCPTIDLVVIVLASAPNSKPPTPSATTDGDNPLVYQLKQIKLLIHVATMRCHSLAQRDLWRQQLELSVEKERNAEDQLAVLSLKCDQWQDQHDLQARLQSGLVSQMALGLPLLYAPKALSSKHLVSMWQALLEILCSRLGDVFKTVARSSVQLYGLVHEANLFFTFGKSSGAKRLQLVSFTQCAKDPTYQTIWKAFVNEATVSKTFGRDGGESANTVFPVMGIIGDDDQRHERVVGLLELQSKPALDEGEQELVHEFLTWFAPALLCIGRGVYRKMMTKKHAARQGVVAPTDDPHQHQLSELAYTSSLSTPGMPSDISHGHDDARAQVSVEINSMSTVESADGDSEDEVQVKRKKKDRLLSGIVTLLLKVQETSDVRSLAKIVRHGVKRLWPYNAKKKSNQGIHECHLLVYDETPTQGSRSNNVADLEIPQWLRELMKANQKTASQRSECQVLRGVVPSTTQYESGEQFRVILLPATSPVSGSFSCLLITGTSLDTLFDADDERVHLLQIATGVHRQLAQLTRLAELQESTADLGEVKRQESFSVAKASRLEQTVADMEGFLVFQSALSCTDTERALNNLVVEYLKKLLQCGRVMFQAVASGDHSRLGIDPSHQSESEDDSGALATSTLEMDNILRLRVLSPNINGRELLAVCTARMGTRAELLDGHKQELLRRVSPLVGSAMHHIRVQEKLNYQVHVTDRAKSDVERLDRENKLLVSQLQQQSLSREDVELRLSDQQTLVAEIQRLEAQCARMACQCDKLSRERDEQQLELAAREKVNARLTFQVDQFAKVEAQIQQVEDKNSALRRRERKLEKKILKQRLELQQLMGQVGQFKQREDFDRHEITQLQRQLTVLSEKQRQQSSGATKESTLRSQSSRYLHHMHHQAHKRKQESLAQELRQLTAMEIREMKLRNREQ